MHYPTAKLRNFFETAGRISQIAAELLTLQSNTVLKMKRHSCYIKEFRRGVASALSAVRSLSAVVVLAVMSVMSVLAQPGPGRPQIQAPVTWKATVENNSTGSATVRLTASIESGWRLYAFELPDDGPNPTVISFELPAGVSLDGPLTPSHKPVEKYDDIFSLNLSWWENSVTFTQELDIADEKPHTVRVSVYYQGCNNESCVAPKTETLEVTVGSAPTVAEDAPASAMAAGKRVISAGNLSADTLGRIVPDVPVAAGNGGNTYGWELLWWAVSLLCVGGGLYALQTRRLRLIVIMGIFAGGVSMALAITGIFGEEIHKALSHCPALLCIWIVLFAMLGLYLLGKLKISRVPEPDYISMPRFILAAASFWVALYLFMNSGL